MEVGTLYISANQIRSFLFHPFEHLHKLSNFPIFRSRSFVQTEIFLNLQNPENPFWVKFLFEDTFRAKNLKLLEIYKRVDKCVYHTGRLGLGKIWVIASIEPSPKLLQDLKIFLHLLRDRQKSRSSEKDLCLREAFQCWSRWIRSRQPFWATLVAQMMGLSSI